MELLVEAPVQTSWVELLAEVFVQKLIADERTNLAIPVPKTVVVK
jgi:hypothetical protein